MHQQNLLCYCVTESSSLIVRIRKNNFLISEIDIECSNVECSSKSFLVFEDST